MTMGWLKWQLAEYTHFTDPVSAQQVLKSALGLNRRITQPIDGVDYENLKSKSLEQAKNAVWKLRAYEGKATAATNPTISKHYANQLSGSMHRFYKRYDQTSKAIAILVHPSRKFEDAATPALQELSQHCAVGFFAK